MGLLLVAALPAVVVFAVGFLLLAGAWSPRFEPTPELRVIRHLVGAAVAVPCGMLMYSLTMTWYVEEDLGVTTVTKGGGSGGFTTYFGVLTGILVVRGVYGHRNWAPQTLLLAWLGLFWPWFRGLNVFVLDPDEHHARVEDGLVLATVSVALLTLMCCVGIAVRFWERYSPPTRRPSLRGMWRTIVGP